MSVERPALGWWVAIVGGLGANALVGFDDAVYAWWTAHVTTALSQPFVRYLFIAAVLAHLGEAFYAYRLARDAGADTAGAWFRQTLVLGFPSLGLLRRRLAAVTPGPSPPR